MIFVTGGTGLVGSHLLFELISSGIKVRALKRPDSDLSSAEKVFRIYGDGKENLFNRIEWVDGDLLDLSSLDEALEGVEDVYHCAAVVSFIQSESDMMHRINVEGTANLVNASLDAGIRNFCYVSSIAALGRPDSHSEMIDEGINWKASRNNSRYAISKYGAEREVWRGMAEGLDIVIVNPSIILGLARPTKGSVRLFTEVRDGLQIYPPGVNGFVDVRDVVKAMVRLMQSDIRGERFILNGANMSYKKLFDAIAREFGVRPPEWKASGWVIDIYWRIEKMRAWLARRKPLVTSETARTSRNRYAYSTEKISKAIGFEFTPVEETIKKYCKLLENDDLS